MCPSRSVMRGTIVLTLSLLISQTLAFPGHAVLRDTQFTQRRGTPVSSTLEVFKAAQFTDIHQSYVQFEDEERRPSARTTASTNGEYCGLTSTPPSVLCVGHDIAEKRKQKRQVNEASLEPASGLTAALKSDFSSALGPVQSAANSNLAGVSLVKSEAPSVIPTADVIGPAQSAAAPVLSGLLDEILSAVQPLISNAETEVLGADQPVASLAVPLQSAILPPVESAVGPLISAIAPALVAALSPAVVQLSSPLGPVESGIITPLESAIAPMLSEVVDGAVSAVSSIEAPISSLLVPVLSQVDSAVLPLVTSVISVVWPAIVPAVTPLNPIICALQPAEVPLGDNATGLIPVQCVSITSGAIIPISTGVATPSLSPSFAETTSTGLSVISMAANLSVPLPAANLTAPAPAPMTQMNSLEAEASSLLSHDLSDATSLLPGLSLPVPSLTPVTALSSAADGSSNVVPLTEIIPESVSIESDAISDTAPPISTCAMAGATLSAASAAQSASGATLPSAADTEPPNTVSESISSKTWESVNTVAPIKAGNTSISSMLDEPSTVTAVISTSESFASGASPTITDGPSLTDQGIILLSYGSQTVSFPAIMLPGGGMIASFIGSILAQPATVAGQSIARRVEPVLGDGGFDIQAFVHDLSSKLSQKYPRLIASSQIGKIDQAVISSSKGHLHQHQGDEQPKNEITLTSEFFDGQFGPISFEQSQTSDAGANLQISSCPDANGTTFVSLARNEYTIVCDTNWIGQDVKYLVSSGFDKCVDSCDSLNSGTIKPLCMAALFVEDVPEGAADCYLKASTQNPSPWTANFTIHAAVRGGNDKTFLDTSNIGSFQQSESLNGESATNDGNEAQPLTHNPADASAPGLNTYNAVHAEQSTNTIELDSMTSLGGLNGTSNSSLLGISAIASVRYASGTTVIAPLIATTQIIGPATAQPAGQYVSLEAVPSATPPGYAKRQDIDGIPDSILNNTGADFALAYDDIDFSTGIIQLNSTTEGSLLNLTNVPHFSRDGGKGGMVNSQHVFTFADTAVYTTENDNSNGHYINYASSSVAIDVGTHALFGNAITLWDSPGEFSNALGAVRGFVPLTTGETGFNKMAAQAGAQARYSIWPESSLIPLNSSSSVMVAPIVYSYAESATKAGKFTYSGNTLLTVVINEKTGPVAERTVGRLFNASDVEWGNVGGLRSWGPSGIGGNDGYVYLFGNVRGGLLLARSEARSVGSASSYEYWNNGSWTVTPIDDDSTAYFIQGSFMDVDVFYSPRHLTFVVVYMNIYGDSTFYWRYLKAPQALRPSYAGGDPSVDFAEALARYPWSDEVVLFSANKGLDGSHAYAGGVHLGYFGDDDLLNGGDKMLLTWTSPTGQDPASKNSAYQLGTGIVQWS